MLIDYKAVGKRIKSARIQADLTQESLADQIRISATHLSNIETGNTRVSLTTIVKLANALSVTVDEFLCDSLLHANIQFEKDIANILADCDSHEVRIIKDILEATKATLRKDAYLRKIGSLSEE